MYKLHVVTLKLYVSFNVVIMTETRRIKLAAHVAWSGKDFVEIFLGGPVSSFKIEF
jgi:hypothetical protein